MLTRPSNLLCIGAATTIGGRGAPCWRNASRQFDLAKVPRGPWDGDEPYTAAQPLTPGNVREGNGGRFHGGVERTGVNLGMVRARADHNWSLLLMLRNDIRCVQMACVTKIVAVFYVARPRAVTGVPRVAARSALCLNRRARERLREA